MTKNILKLILRVGSSYTGIYDPKIGVRNIIFTLNSIK